MSRTTYERLKAFCEANNVSMSQLVETRVNDFLGEGATAPVPTTITPRPAAPAPAPRTSNTAPAAAATPSRSGAEAPAARTSSPAIPMTSAAARYAVDPPPPIIKPKQETAAPKPAEKRPDQIFTF